jgi:hypothetical protein
MVSQVLSERILGRTRPWMTTDGLAAEAFLEGKPTTRLAVTALWNPFAAGVCACMKAKGSRSEITFFTVNSLP